MPATPDIPGLLPTADELTALYNTALDYDVPLSDRVNLIQGVDDADPRLAQKFVQEGMTVEFHLVVDRGDGSLLAFGNPVLQAGTAGRVSDSVRRRRRSMEDRQKLGMLTGRLLGKAQPVRGRCASAPYELLPNGPGGGWTG